MPLETGTYISDLNPLNPAASDASSQGDDHLRLVKLTLKNTFPNVNGAVSATDEQLSNLASGLVSLADGTSGAPSLSFTSQPTLGFYRVSAGTLGITGNVNLGAATLTGALTGTSASFSGTLGAGATTLTGALTGTSASFSTTLGATGAATFGSTGSFAGALTVTSGGAAITGNSSVTGTFGVSGALTGSTGAFSGTLSTNTTLAVGGTASLNGNVTVGGSLSVTGSFSPSNLVATNAAKAFMRYSGGVVTSYNCTVTSIGTNSVSISFTGPTPQGVAVASLEGSAAAGLGFVQVQWVGPTDMVVRTYNTATGPP
jgi:hypothetical protein